MNWFLRILDALFPSVPPLDQVRVLAAMEGRSLTPAPGHAGEGWPGAGHTPEDGRKAPSSGTEVLSDSTPARGSAWSASRSPVPEVEDLRNWRAHPSHRWEFADTHLGALLDLWRGELA